MSDVLHQSSKTRFVRLRTTVIGILLTAAVFGTGAYFVGHQEGVDDAGPSVDFIHQQQAASVERLMQTTRNLVAIEQDTVELLTGKSGAEVDAVALSALRLQYTKAYDPVLAERGRISRLFGAPVRAAAKAISHYDNVALNALYPERAKLPTLTFAEIHAVIVNSHTARKAQWSAFRRFSQAATEEMLGNP